MNNARPVAEKPLLSPGDHVLVLVGVETQASSSAKSFSFPLIRNNAATVIDTAKSFDVPMVLTAIGEESFSHAMFSEVVGTFDHPPRVDRTGMTWWEGAAVIDEVNRIGRDRVVFAGPRTSGCIVELAALAADHGLDACFVADACGDISMRAHERSVRQMIRMGARPMTSLQYLLELLCHSARADTYDWAAEISRARHGLPRVPCTRMRPGDRSGNPRI